MRIGEVVEQAVNITGDIPGSDLKDQIVMLGAHFDTWHASPNASDNTSGVAVALEAGYSTSAWKDPGRQNARRERTT